MAANNLTPASIETYLAMLETPDLRERERARRALSEMGKDAIPGLLRTLKEGGPVLRQEAIHVLATLDNPAAVPALIRALEDQESSVRWAAAEGLTRVGWASVEPLLQALIQRSESLYLRRGVLHVLREMGGRGHVELQPVIEALVGVEPDLTSLTAAQQVLNTLGEQST